MEKIAPRRLTPLLFCLPFVPQAATPARLFVGNGIAANQRDARASTPNCNQLKHHHLKAQAPKRITKQTRLALRAILGAKVRLN
jgi:hypothetical protein